MKRTTQQAAMLASALFVGTAAAQNAEQDVRHLAAAHAGEAYAVEGDAITAVNGTRYHNRPLYCNHAPAMVLAGDRPCVRLVRDPYVYGCLLVAYARDDKAVWLHEAAQRKSLYRAGRMEWQIADPAFEGAGVSLEVVPLADGVGFAVRLTSSAARAGDSLIVAFGAATRRPDAQQPNLAWSLDPRGNAGLQTRGFVAEDCRENRVRIENDAFVLVPPAYEPAANVPVHVVAGRCSAACTWAVADAAVCGDPRKLTTATADPALPLALGVIKLAAGENRMWLALEGLPGEKPFCPASPQAAFDAGLERMQTIAQQVTIDTPEPRLDALVAAACHGIDGAWYPPVYVHGGMLWNVPFPGWRTLYGPTVLGWHEHVRQEAAYYIAHQEQADTKREPKSEPAVGYGQESSGSRFYGQGHINQDQAFYNFQSVFFDMLIHAWRWTGDEALKKILKPALDLHVKWQRECFDPDGDGLYESYINTWPTDSVWYAGGAGVEETAFAYTALRAAADMAGDPEAARTLGQRAEFIADAFQRRFWIADRGHPGTYIEQTGAGRLHTDSWLYSIFMPIDAGLLDGNIMQAWQALYYTEWGLQRVRSPLGGERCWTSNWVPSVWSTRVLYPGDNYHLALAYFQSGQADRGWDILRGAAYEAGYNGPVPGCVATSVGGTDFTDCTSMFARAVVEGLFGCRPDYAHGIVRFRPAFPSTWTHASIKTPDFSLQFERTAGIDRYDISLTRPARIELNTVQKVQQLQRCCAAGLAASTQIAAEPDVHPEPQALEFLSLPHLDGLRVTATTVAEVSSVVFTLTRGEEAPMSESSELEVQTGEPVQLRAPAGRIVGADDPQHALVDMQLADGQIIARATSNTGHHMLFGVVEVRPETPARIHAFRLNVSPRTDIAGRDLRPRDLPARATWTCVDLSKMLNGDVRTIYRQQYLSPRPKTCSVRIGADGYSPWTFYYWNAKPPEIDLDNVAGMLDGRGRMLAHGVPFIWPEGSRNIAFTSTWDNWPQTISLPVNRSGEAVWLLVCGTTNPMQTRISNASIRLVYQDGSVDTLDLVPPLNFWGLCPIRGVDYDEKTEAFCLPKQPPAAVQLGRNCRAMLIGRRLRTGAVLQRIEMEALSPEVVIGIMGVSIQSKGE